MKYVIAILFLMGPAAVFAGSAFEATDVTQLKREQEQAQQASREREFARLFSYNEKLVSSIPVFAAEHGGLATEPVCNSQNWRCSDGGACVPNVPHPWNPYQSLSSINLNSWMQIMNCNVNVKDGWECVLNWMGPQGESIGLTFHCKRDGYQKDFTVKGTKRSR